MPSERSAPSRMSKEAIIAEMTEAEGHGYDIEELKAKSRPDLVKLLKEHRDGKDAAEALERAQEVVEPVGVSQGEEGAPDAIAAPLISDPGWTQYVIGKLASDELEGQNPRLEGLRRVAEELIGEIVEEGCDLIAAPSPANNERACVKAWIVFDTESGRKRYEGLADVSPLNCDESFAKFPTSTAESRAKGRCFRAALHLKRVIAAEEADGNIPLSGEVGVGGDDAIQGGQVHVARLMTDRLNISVTALLKDLEIEKSDLKSLTKDEGLMVIRRLNQLQTGEIPKRLLRGGEPK